MPHNTAYQNAEQKIATALRTGATELDLSCTWNAKDSEKLTELPEWLGQLTKLQTLFLHGNQLTALPESLGQLTQLQKFAVEVNNLTMLPDWIGRLTLLRELSVVGNQLESLPDTIGEYALATLEINGNCNWGVS